MSLTSHLYEQFCRLPLEKKENFDNEILNLLYDENWIERRGLTYSNPDKRRAVNWVLNQEQEKIKIPSRLPLQQHADSQE